MQFSTCVTATLHHSLIILCKAYLHSWAISLCNVCCLLVCLFIVCFDVPGDYSIADKTLACKEGSPTCKTTQEFYGCLLKNLSLRKNKLLIQIAPRFCSQILNLKIILI